MVKKVSVAKNKKPPNHQAAIPIFTLIILLIIWEVGVRIFNVPEFILPAPSKIIASCAEVPASVAMHTLATFRTIMLGFIVSIVLSFPIALLIASSRLMANAIYPLLILTQSIPKVALAPLLVLILGTNELPRVVITFLVAFFPLVVSISTGLMAVPAELLELGKSCKASSRQILLKIRLPYAIPFIFSGLKVAITLCVVGAVVAEFVNADRGLGYLIVTSTAFFKTSLAYGAVVILSIMGILLFQMLVLLEKIFFPWAVSSQQHDKQ
ncbi:ABC transporter permease [Brenneria goodwinii]|uniref:Hydroxymethylpyrimidine ABC transporter, transmembrane component n=1 Tax=Brenneria goodwinii TaxID=1109412 RepID=A0A0G4JX68_9GAMM|nr:ABC transporter permease [Brenneria goodwinii]CPR17996.1 Hydroxymethylpyrimidine ABC transporter, transmembrane component [Brenneria goodwinii]